MTTDQNSANPFASPPSLGETVKVVVGSYEIEGNKILGNESIILPHACVKCGEVLSEQDGDSRRKKDLYWAHPGIYVLVLIQLIVFLIVYLVTRKKCHVEYSVCRDCNAKQRMNIVYCIISLAVFIGMIALMINLENALFSLGVVISFAVMITFAIRANGPLSVKALPQGAFELRGASPEFLQVAANYSDTQATPAAVLAEDGRMA